MRRRLAEGAKKLGVGVLCSQTLDKELMFLQELLRWNQKINLTAVNDINLALEKHLLDSLIVAKYLVDGDLVYDLGSGAGLPSIPLAIARKDVEFYSIESVLKKVNFQRHIKRLLGLYNFNVIHSRIEDLHADQYFAGKGTVVVARALASLSELIALAGPLLASGGKLIAMKGGEAPEEIEATVKCLSVEFDSDIEVNSYILPWSRVQYFLIEIWKK